MQMKPIFTLNDNNVVKQTLLAAPEPLEFTLQFWLQAEGSGALFQYSINADNAFSLGVNEQGKLVLTCFTEGAVHSEQTIRGGINDKSQNHVAVIRKDHVLSVFVNGKLIPCREGRSVASTKEIQQQAQKSPNLIIGNSDNNNGSSLKGLLAGIKLWGKALPFSELRNFRQQETEPTKANGVLYSYLIAPSKSLPADELEKENRQTATIKLINDSPFDLCLSPIICSAKSDNQFPSMLSAHKTTLICLSEFSDFNKKASYRYQNSSDDPFHNANQNKISLNIEINKSLIAFESWVKAQASPRLQREITPQSLPNELDQEEQEYNQLDFKAEIRVSENLVIVNAKNLNQCINAMMDGVEVLGKKLPGLKPSQIVMSMNYRQDSGEASSTAKQIIDYNQSCQLFNRRVQKKPLAIIYCESAENVQVAYLSAINNNLPISVRSGGHDHEGECSATNSILIDLMGLSGVNVNPKYPPKGIVANAHLAEIGAGNRFITLTTALADKGVMIPHGTCASVAIPGFLMGGGWGPWTRKYGMCCEHLVGAEIILGDGTREVISASNKPDLLWALKGGGGLSYGIVTNFYIQTFDLPETMIKFELEWNPYNLSDQSLNEDPNEGASTLDLLKAWEKVISSPETEKLQGTNLKINGKPKPDCANFSYTKVKHNCVMYGYFVGNEEELNKFISKWFAGNFLTPSAIRIDGIGGLGKDYGRQLMSSWDRESFQHVKNKSIRIQPKNNPNLPFPPDLDEPAPHKITSRLVTKALEKDGYKALLMSLTSPLILEGSRQEGVFNYVTLGAIDGKYYKNLSPEEKGLVEGNKGQSTFPYKTRPYIIQYQTWWNLDLEEKEKLQDNEAYKVINRALDWMQVCRDADIPNTSGSFISFKDSSIPTESYFGSSYEELKKIKKNYSKDYMNHFRSRKTII